MQVVRQEGIKDCGVCCILSVMRHFGGNASLEYLREITNTTKNGVSAYNIVSSLTTLGFNSYGIKTDISKITNDMLPIISHVIVNKSYQHFIVIYKIDKIKNKLLVMDPAIGKRELSIKEFNLMTSNNYIYLKPIKKILSLKKKKIIKSLLLEFIKNNNKYIPYIFTSTIFYFIFNLSFALYFKIIVNKAINYSIISNVYLISNLIIIILIIKEISNLLKNFLLIKYSYQLNEFLEIKILKRLTLLPYLYYKNRTTGEIVSRLKDLEVIKNFLLHLLSSFFTDIIIIIVFIYLLFTINFKLSIIILIISIIFFLFELLLNKLYIKYYDKYLAREDKVNGLLYENINSMPTIKSLHLEKTKINDFIKVFQKFLSSAYLCNKLIIIDEIINNINVNFIYILLTTFGSILIIKGKFSIASLIVYQSILNYYLSSYNNIISIIKEYKKYSISKRRIEDLFTIDVENFNCIEYFEKCSLARTIKIKNLDYSYGTKKIFNNLNLTIKSKDKIFLTGASGIGKSTLMKILIRFINIEYGHITIGNIDINHYHLDTIRNRIIYVSQKESLFTSTIKNNILFNEDEKKLDEILKITQVDRLLDKELSLNKIIEEDGANFSGGERQKIILARSLIKDADIYIFDEALNQIDIEDEKKILTEILKYLKNKIVIVISHRLTCKDLFNRILILKDGEIHEEL